MKKEQIIKYLKDCMLGFAFAYALLDIYFSGYISAKRGMEREKRAEKQHQERMKIEEKQHQEVMEMLKKRQHRENMIIERLNKLEKKGR